MVNCIIFAVLLAAIGGCYVWLGVKMNARAAGINIIRNDIKELERQINAANQHIGRKILPDELSIRVAKGKPGLKSIPTGRGGRLVKLPEPPLNGESRPADLKLAVIQQP